MPNETPDAPEQSATYSHIRAVRDLKNGAKTGKANHFDLTPDADQRAIVAEQIGAISIRKLRFQGDIRAHNKSDWQLVAKLGATVDQTCVITAEKVTTRVDVPVERLYLRAMDNTPAGGEIEFDGNDDIEPLGEEIDLGTVLSEALLLALPDYPRVEGAALEESVFTEPGITPMTKEAAKPFATLAALRDKLAK